MDRLTSLRVFREIIESGSFAAAAKRLGVSAPMASKHVAELERVAGARLLHRSSRRLSPTEAGESYYAHCRQALEILDAADAEIHQRSATPRGCLKISAPVWCANPRFALALADYHRRHPEVVVDLRLDNRMVDLVAEGFDLALRATPEPSSNLYARKICEVKMMAVATPDFLARHEASNAGNDLQTMEFIAPSYFDFRKRFPARSARATSISPKIVMQTDDTILSHLAVLAGIGAAVLPDWIVGADVTEGRLISFEIGHPLPTLTLHAVYASRRHVPLKLRSFIDFFSKQLDGHANAHDDTPRFVEALARSHS